MGGKKMVTLKPLQLNVTIKSYLLKGQKSDTLVIIINEKNTKKGEKSDTLTIKKPLII